MMAIQTLRAVPDLGEGHFEAPLSPHHDAAADIEELLGLFSSDTNDSLDFPSEDDLQLSPTFAACFASLPPVEEWLLPAPAAPQQPTLQLPPPTQTSLRFKRPLSQLTPAAPAINYHFQSALQEAQRAPIFTAAKLPEPVSSSTSFFEIPSIASIPVEGGAATLPSTVFGLARTTTPPVALQQRSLVAPSAPSPVARHSSSARMVPASISVPLTTSFLSAGAAPSTNFSTASKADPSAKRAKVQRYLAKREKRLRNANKPTTYVRRTQLANQRPRVGGRFISQPSMFVPVTKL